MNYIRLLSLVLVPQLAVASELEFSEIAWMGSHDNANAEWVELYNRGAENIEVTGWTISTIDGKLTIALEGTAPSGAFYILERSSDDTLPQIQASKIYTGALANTGEHLMLKNAIGDIIDEVNASDGWPGGDNETKDTMQKVGSSWTSGKATPKASNTGEATPVPSSSASSAPQTTSNTTSKTTKKKLVVRTSETRPAKATTTPRRKPALLVEAEYTDAVTVGTAHTFLAHAYDQDGDELSNVQFSWNMGDGTTKAGASISHTYLYPGQYVISLTGSRTSFENKLTARDRTIISVASASIEISAATPQYIELSNPQTHEIDISHWSIVHPSGTFVIPQDTILVSGSKLRFAASVTKLAPDNPFEVRLLYPSGELAVQYVEPHPEEIAEIKEDEAVEEEEFVASEDTAETEETAQKPDELPFKEIETKPRAPVAAAYAAEPEHHEENPSSPWLWFLSLVGVIGVSSGIYMVMRQESFETLGSIDSIYLHDDDLAEWYENTVEDDPPKRRNRSI